jgi:hypothetical protein
MVHTLLLKLTPVLLKKNTCINILYIHKTYKKIIDTVQNFEPNGLSPYLIGTGISKHPDKRHETEHHQDPGPYASLEQWHVFLLFPRPALKH